MTGEWTLALTQGLHSRETMIMSGSDIDVRRRRALWRATHRGTKEMDFLLGRFATQTVDDMDPAEIEVLERLVDTPDPEIERSFFGGNSLGAPDLDELIGKLRRFHGMGEAR